jgi:two-component system sensor kinase FixL
MTEEERLNKELRLREALLQSMLDIVPDGLVTIDTKGIVQSFNPSAQRAFGYAANEVVGQNVSILMPYRYGHAHDGFLEHYLRTGERRIIGIGRIVLGQCKDGSTFPMELQVGEVDIEGAHFFVGFVRDLTARREHERRMAELQAEVLHLSRLSDLGHMASAIAHEVNQPLAAIGNYIGGIRRLLTDDMSPILRQAIERVGAQAERARDIVASLRGLVKKGDRPRETLNLETLIRETSALALVGTNRAVGLDLRVPPDAANGHVNKVQIQQVLLNLIRNAVEAMDGVPGSRLTIATERTGDRVAFAVSDTGPGLPEAVRARLFQPFTTTKPDGLGVGLSICRTIVESHGGELSADPPSERGTVFRFSVPARDDLEAPGS